jgi:hypothetical protein
MFAQKIVFKKMVIRRGIYSIYELLLHVLFNIVTHHNHVVRTELHVGIAFLQMVLFKSPSWI